MTDRTSEVIEAIDGALSDWSTSGDAMRWVPPEGRTEPPVEPAQVLWLMDDWVAAIAAATSQYLEEVVVAFDALGAALRDAGVLVDELSVELEDPKSRALRLRQARNTGPAQRMRAPRHLPPGRLR